MKRFLAILTAIIVAIPGFMFQVPVFAGPDPQVIAEEYDYVAEEGDFVHYSVKVLNVDDDDEVSYQWYYTVNCLASDSKFPGDKVYKGSWYTLWYYASGFDRIVTNEEKASKHAQTSSFTWVPKESDTTADVDNQWAFICRVTVNGKTYNSSVFTTTVVAKDWLTDDIKLTVDESNIKPGNRMDKTEVSCANEHMTLGEVSWEKLSAGNWESIDSSKKFDEGSYRMKINISLEGEYRYKTNPTAFVNDESVNVLARHNSGGKDLIVYKTYFINEKFQTSSEFSPYKTQYTKGNIFRVSLDAPLYANLTSAVKTDTLKKDALVVLLEDGAKDGFYHVRTKENSIEGYIDSKALDFYGYGNGEETYKEMQNYFVHHPVDVLGDSVYGDVIGTLPYGVVITATEYFGYFAKINYNGHDGWVYAYWISKTNEPATDISYLFDTQGYYRVTTAANIRLGMTSDSKRMGGLKAGDIIYVTGTSDEYFGFSYGGHNCFVAKSALEKLPEEDIRDIDPWVVESPQSQHIKEGESVTFRISADAYAYADKAYQSGDEIRYGRYKYFWMADIPLPWIEMQGLGTISYNEDMSELTISNCSKELDNMEVRCNVQGFTTVSSEKALLEVEANPEPTVDEVQISGVNPTVSFLSGSTIVNHNGGGKNDGGKDPNVSYQDSSTIKNENGNGSNDGGKDPNVSYQDSSTIVNENGNGSNDGGKDPNVSFEDDSVIKNENGNSSDDGGKDPNVSFEDDSIIKNENDNSSDDGGKDPNVSFEDDSIIKNENENGLDDGGVDVAVTLTGSDGPVITSDNEDLVSVHDGGVDPSGVHFVTFSLSGAKFAPHPEDYITVVDPEVDLKEAFLDEYGQLKVALTSKSIKESESTDKSLLYMESGEMVTEEKQSIDIKFDMTNETGAKSKVSLLKGELPKGLELTDEGIKGTPEAGTAGCYLVRFGIDTDKYVKETVEKKPVYKTVKDYVTKTETYTEKVPDLTWHMTVDVGGADVVPYNIEGPGDSEFDWFSSASTSGGNCTFSYYDGDVFYEKATGTLAIDKSRTDEYGHYPATLTTYKEVTKTREVQVENGSHEELDYYEEVKNQEEVKAQHAETVMTIIVPSEHVHEHVAAETKGDECEGADITYTCSCGDSYVLHIGGGHLVSSWKNEASEEGTILRARSCMRCGYRETMEIPEEEHQDSDNDLICDFCRTDLTAEAIARATGYSVEEIKAGKDLSDWSDHMEFVEDGTPKGLENASAKRMSLWLIILLIILGILLLLGLILLILFLLKKKKEKEEEEEKKNKEKEKSV